MLCVSFVISPPTSSISATNFDHPRRLWSPSPTTARRLPIYQYEMSLERKVALPCVSRPSPTSSSLIQVKRHFTLQRRISLLDLDLIPGHDTSMRPGLILRGDSKDDKRLTFISKFPSGTMLSTEVDRPATTTSASNTIAIRFLKLLTDIGTDVWQLALAPGVVTKPNLASMAVPPHASAFSRSSSPLPPEASRRPAAAWRLMTLA
ncbi:hypothetical protein AC579_7946 [Pseudocercospora musae]|uniref:Uncharacterized protein n=1 Tax=Pseudocercospora musae TaxID=113226 RepID=A0A139I8Z2_9PEZI|nr:hypothetical protein AC579_7946 [Pseudocercospora musae]